MLKDVVLSAPGFEIHGEPDLNVDWKTISERMTRFQAYPYTSVGVVLTKQ